MKALILIMIFTSLAQASPMQQMDQRIKTYNEARVRCEEGNSQHSDEGLFIDVSCDFQCKDLVPKVERAKGTFIPRNMGLFPGNGSNDENTLWSAVGVSLKVWSQKICFEKAVEGCKSAQEVESFGIREIQSGAWTMTKFPGCHEKGRIVSPFDNTAGSVRLGSIAGLITPPTISPTIDFNENGMKFTLQPGTLKADCKKPIKAKMCFGDCIDLASSENEIVETLSTSEPLGSDDMEICGDELAMKLQDLKLSASVRREVCEAYFWQSFMKRENKYKSCAAIRGDTTCETF